MSERKKTDLSNEDKKLTPTFWLAALCLVSFSPFLFLIVEVFVSKGGPFGLGYTLIPYLLPTLICPSILIWRIIFNKDFGIVLPSVGLSFNLLLLIFAAYATYLT